MDAQQFVQSLMARGVNLFTGVPCSFFQSVYTLFSNDYPQLYVPAANEGTAQAIAAGAELAGTRSAVLIQNSGLGNLVNPLTSLHAPYRVGGLLFVSGRAFGVKDEPQHVVMGRITRELLEQCEARTWVMESDVAGFERQLDEVQRVRESESKLCAFIVPKGSIAPYKARPALPDRPLSRADVLRITAKLAPSDAALVTTTGKCSREMFVVDDQPRNFYCMGTMGHASAIGLGVARAQPQRPVIVLDGDGAALMHMGVFSTIGAMAPTKLVHIVIDNETYESTGNQLTTASTTRFADVARACNYREATMVDDEAAYRQALRRALEVDGPSLLHVKVRLEGIPDVPRITTRHSAPQIAEHFSAFLGGAEEA